MTDEELQERYDRLVSENGDRHWLLCTHEADSKRKDGLNKGACDVCGEGILYPDIVPGIMFICNRCVLRLKDLRLDMVGIPARALPGRHAAM